MRLALIAALLLFAQAQTTRAEVPRVVADILPVHALVARVMDGVGTPALAVAPGASAHANAMRPSVAQALQDATLVVWIGPELTPWLEAALSNLAPDAARLTLLDHPDTVRLPYREGALFSGKHDHDHGHDHAHDADGTDPHAWLDPENARIWTGAIAHALSEADPANAARYEANASEAIAEIDATASALADRLANVKELPFVVFHDAYQYFEVRFGLSPLGALLHSDTTAPGATRIAMLRDGLSASGTRCLFTEPQFDPKLADTLIEGTGMRTAVLDPLGAQAHTTSYPKLLESMGDAIATCLGGES